MDAPDGTSTNLELQTSNPSDKVFTSEIKSVQTSAPCGIPGNEFLKRNQCEEFYKPPIPPPQRKKTFAELDADLDAYYERLRTKVMSDEPPVFEKKPPNPWYPYIWWGAHIYMGLGFLVILMGVYKCIQFKNLFSGMF